MSARWFARADPHLEVQTLEQDDYLRRAYDAHGAELYRFALRQLSDPGAAQDAVQETFLRAWRKADSYAPDIADLRVWLFTIARNVIIDESRRSKVRPWHHPVDPEVGETQQAPAGFEDEILHSWLVEEALLKLSPEHREVIVDVHLRGRPQPEVAAELGVPIGTVRSRVFYGLKSLRIALEEMGVTP